MCFIYIHTCYKQTKKIQMWYPGKMWQAQSPGTQCTCVWPHLFVPESASQHPSPGPHTSHRLQTSDKRGRGHDTREWERHLSYRGDRHSRCWSFHNMVPPGPKCQCSTVEIKSHKVCAFTLWSNPHFQNKTWLNYLCLYTARLEAGDVGGHFADITEVNLAQAIVVESPQLES